MIDLAACRLLLDDRPVELRPKTWEVLQVLVERPGELITKDELLDRVWADTAVSEGTLNKSIGELRAALADSREAPRCIETVPRRGFRWIGTARILRPASSGAARTTSILEGNAPADEAAAMGLVARSGEIAALEACLAKARGGRRQVVFVTGEAGAGKTTLVDHFLERVARSDGNVVPLVAHGQCLETSGPHEPYLPLLDAFERLARDVRVGATVTQLLRRFAPAWVAQLPALAATGDAATNPAPAPGSMLRELAGVVDEIARDRPLVLVLEDAHWADLATTDACAALARRRDPAQLLLVITKRAAEAVLTDHPIVALKKSLVSRQAAEEIGMEPFGSDDVQAYLAARCPGLERSDDTAEWMLQQTHGNPLFVRLVLDEWLARGLVAVDDSGRWSRRGDEEEVRRTVPDSLRALLELQVERLAAGERALIEAASVRMGAFHAASVAAAAGLDVDEAEAICETIARSGQLLREAGSATSGTGRIGAQYAFFHATVQRVVVAGLSSARLRRLHLAAAQQMESEYAGRTQSVAAILALHYEEAGDVARAASHHLSAALVAMHRDAPRDAIAMLETVCALLDANPDLPGLDNERLMAMRFLTHAHQLAYGFVDAKVRELWDHTSEMAAATGNFAEQIVAAAGRIVSGCVAAGYAETERIVRETLPIVERVSDAGALKTFLFAAGTLRYRIAMLGESSAMFERALAMPHEGDPIPGNDMDALLMSQYAPAVAIGGRIDELRRISEVSVQRAKAHSHYSECVTAAMVSWALVLVGDHDLADPIAARTLEIALADNFPTWSTRQLVIVGVGKIAAGQVDEGLQQIRRGMTERKADGQICDQSAMCCLVAEALLRAGLPGAEDYVQEAADFVSTTGELFAESEVLRLRANIRREDGAAPGEVEPLLRNAFELARLRGIHWHAMRAATDLASLLLGQGRGAEAASVLEPALAAIVGGGDLRAVREAREILAACRNPQDRD